jgi:hypothetical protein
MTPRNPFSDYQFRMSDTPFQLGNSQNLAQHRSQQQQLTDARERRSQDLLSGFEDDADNLRDDRARSSQAFANFQQKTDKNMTTPSKVNDNSSSGKATINSSRPSDYGKGEKLLSDREATLVRQQTDMRGQDIKSLTDLQNFASRSRDNRYATEANTAVGFNKNAGDVKVGLDKNRVTRDVGFDQNAKQLEASNVRTFADFKAAMDKNVKQSADNRFETSTKFATQERMNTFNRNTIDRTELATAQVKAGTFGVGQDELNKRAGDKSNFDNWKKQNDANFDYADRQNAQIKMGRDIGNAERAYNDSRQDLSNDRGAAMHRFQVEQNNKNADRSARFEEQKQLREDRKADFGLRSSQINAEVARSAQESTYRMQLLQAQTAQIRDDSVFRNRKLEADTAAVFSNTRLKDLQFAASRSDIGYNRGNQFGRSLAF